MKNTITKAENQGFTLVELMIVIVIIGILAGTMIVSFNSPKRRLKNAVFVLRNDLNLARSEAVNKSKNVYVTFVDSATSDGYRIWADMDGSGAYTSAADGAYIKDVTFQNGIQYYDTTVSGGPKRDGTEGPVNNSTGVDLGAATFFMQPNGTSNTDAAIYLYFTDTANHAVMQAVPLRMAVTSTTGRVRVEFWNEPSLSWETK